jgi:photosystem II stability/assembly factor-like uncharacterized protein
VDQANPLRVFGEFQGSGNLYRSTNGGTSFSLSSSGISAGDRNCFLPVFLIDPLDSNHMLYGTHRVYRSTNAGSSWSAISGDLSNGAGAIRALAMAPSDPNRVYAATNDGNVLRSDDGGATFITLLTGNPGWPRTTRELTVDPVSPDTVYLAVASFGVDQVRRSTDAGATWTALDGNLPDEPVNVVAVDSRISPPVLFAGSDTGVWRSIDDGVTWHRYGTGLSTAAVVDLLVEPGRERLAAATQGRGAWVILGLIPGDLNADGRIELTDLGLVLADYGCSASCGADVDGDGDVDLSDLGLVLSNYGFGV